jgi:hypothetical protein
MALTLPTPLPQHLKPALKAILVDCIGSEDEVQQAIVEERLEGRNVRSSFGKQSVEGVGASVGDSQELTRQGSATQTDMQGMGVSYPRSRVM